MAKGWVVLWKSTLVFPHAWYFSATPFRQLPFATPENRDAAAIIVTADAPSDILAFPFSFFLPLGEAGGVTSLVGLASPPASAVTFAVAVFLT